MVSNLKGLDKTDYWKKKTTRTLGNITYIGELIRRKFLPFKVFYFGINYLF